LNKLFLSGAAADEYLRTNHKPGAEYSDATAMVEVNDTTAVNCARASILQRCGAIAAQGAAKANVRA
jgi:hypothetical protein